MIGLFFPNRAVTGATFSGGSWLAALPVTNLADPSLEVVARSSTDAEADTKIRIDLGTARQLRAFALVNHNLSSAAQWRVLLGTTSGGSEVYSGTLATWLDTTFETGIAGKGMEDAEYLRDGTHALIVLPAFYSARYITIEISDTSNADGYVQVGRVFAGGGFIPTYNASYGLQDGWVDFSTADQSESGALWAVARRRLKTVRLVLEGLSIDEGDTLHEMLRVLGTIDEVLYVPDLADIGRSQRYGMLGTMKELSALEYPFFRMRKLPVSIQQKG